MDKVRALDYGADDYIVFWHYGTLSRVRAVLCAEPSPKPRKLSYGGIEMDYDRHSATSDGKEIVLTNKEFELLRCMISTPEIVYTRDKLLDGVWGVTYYGDSRTVDAHIRSLLQKLGKNYYLIETVRGVGYKIGAVKRNLKNEIRYFERSSSLALLSATFQY